MSPHAGYQLGELSIAIWSVPDQFRAPPPVWNTCTRSSFPADRGQLIVPPQLSSFIAGNLLPNVPFVVENWKNDRPIDAAAPDTDAENDIEYMPDWGMTRFCADENDHPGLLRMNSVPYRTSGPVFSGTLERANVIVAPCWRPARYSHGPPTPDSTMSCRVSVRHTISGGGSTMCSLPATAMYADRLAFASAVDPAMRTPGFDRDRLSRAVTMSGVSVGDGMTWWSVLYWGMVRLPRGWWR